MTDAVVYTVLPTAPALFSFISVHPSILQSVTLEFNKAGYTNRHKSRGLGRSGNVEGRGSGECRIHDSFSRVSLGRSGDEKTARKTPKTPKKEMEDRQTDRPTDRPTD